MHNKAFYNFMIRQVPKFDEQILKDIELPEMEWVGDFGPPWWFSREKVRKIVEGTCYVKSEYVELDWGFRFDAPDLSEAWKHT